MRIRLPIFAAACALAAASCGSDGPTTVAEPSGAGAGEPAVSGSSQADAPDGNAASQSPSTSEAQLDADVPENEVPAADATAQGNAADGTTGDGAAGDDTVANGTATDGNAVQDSAAAAPVDPGDVPNLEMVNLHTDAPVNLQSVVDGHTPVLLWFWAPH